MKINQNSTLKHKKRLKTLENSGIWPQEDGASNPQDQLDLLKTSFTFRKLYYQGLVPSKLEFCQNRNYRKLKIFSFSVFFENFKNEIRFTRSTKINQNHSPATAPKFGVLSQATKNKTYTPKNICSSVSKDRSHGEYLAQFYAT